MAESYKGVTIEESLGDKGVLGEVRILDTRVEEVTEEHKTPWVKQWTLHTVEIPEDRAEEMAEKISKSLDRRHAWYADFKNKEFHYIIFRDRVFRVNRESKEEYSEVTKYGVSIGILEYQLDFSPEVN